MNGAASDDEHRLACVQHTGSHSPSLLTSLLLNVQPARHKSQYWAPNMVHPWGEQLASWQWVASLYLEKGNISTFRLLNILDMNLSPACRAQPAITIIQGLINCLSDCYAESLILHKFTLDKEIHSAAKKVHMGTGLHDPLVLLLSSPSETSGLPEHCNNLDSTPKL